MLGGGRRTQGITSAARAEVFNKPSDDFLEDELVKEEKQDESNSEQVLLSWQSHLRIDNSLDSLGIPLLCFYSCVITIFLSLSNVWKRTNKIRNKPHQITGRHC